MTREHKKQMVVSEYFAGIGLAKIGLEQAGLRVTWSNDISVKKHAVFSKHHGRSVEGHQYVVGDLGSVDTDAMPEEIDLGWASFPCTDLSLAGARKGIHKGASSSFWLFIKNLSRLGGRRPRVIALENVAGFATSGGGQDIRTAIRSLNGLGYAIDVLSIDARRFLPQSRPRIFLIGRLDNIVDDSTPSDLRPAWLDFIFDDPTLRTFRSPLPPAPPLLRQGFTDLADTIPAHDSRWWDASRVVAFVGSLSEMQSERLRDLTRTPGRNLRTAYRRMRGGVPRWEIRRDDIAGCLRTASGGSSIQAVVEFDSGVLRIRWMTPLEYAKLMGAPTYNIAGATNSEVYSGFGDAVCVPVVKWLAQNCLIASTDSITVPEQVLETSLSVA